MDVIAWIGTIVIFSAVGCAIEIAESKHRARRIQRLEDTKVTDTDIRRCA